MNRRVSLLANVAMQWFDCFAKFGVIDVVLFKLRRRKNVGCVENSFPSKLSNSRGSKCIFLTIRLLGLVLASFGLCQPPPRNIVRQEDLASRAQQALPIFCRCFGKRLPVVDDGFEQLNGRA